MLDPKDEPAVLRNMKEKRAFLPALFWGGNRRWQGGEGTENGGRLTVEGSLNPNVIVEDGSNTSNPSNFAASAHDVQIIAGATETDMLGTATATTSTTTSGQLPAFLVGSIMDFVPYKDLRTALLTGKLMANVISKQVNTINIMNASELVPAAVRRFPNVTEVNCLCLLTKAASTRPRLELSVATAMRVVPFFVRVSEARVRVFGSAASG